LIQFNSVFDYLRVDLTGQWPITKLSLIYKNNIPTTKPQEKEIQAKYTAIQYI